MKKLTALLLLIVFTVPSTIQADALVRRARGLLTRETQQLKGGVEEEIEKKKQNFELWNKHGDEWLYFALTPSLDELKTVFEVGPGKRFNGTFDNTKNTYYLITTRPYKSPFADEHYKERVYKISPVGPDTTMYLRLSADGRITPQTGKRWGIDLVTESGLSLEKNVRGEESLEHRVIKKVLIGGPQNFTLLKDQKPPQWFKDKIKMGNFE